MRSIAQAGVFRPLITLGKTGESVARNAGGLGLLVWRTLTVVLTGKLPWSELRAQLFAVGVESVPLVITTAMLSGIVTTQQGGYQFSSSVPLYILGSVVVASVVLELGPVMTAFVLIGRVGARITAEIGTMQVSEQIDAMHALGRDPIRYLAAPRIVAGLVAMPMLVALANATGILAGMVAAQAAAGLGADAFLYGARLYWHNWDLFYSIMKAVVFGFVIPLVSVHMGFSTRGGAEGVGRATTASVVFMILSILFLDAMFPPLLLAR